MNAWSVFTVAFASVVLHAWISRKGARDWYMGCIVPLIYGGVVAWMFLGDDVTRSLQIILFGSAIPILLMLFFRHRQRDNEANESPAPDQPPCSGQSGISADK